MRVVASSSSSLACELDEFVSYAPPRRRLTTGSHAEFVGALVHEFRGALASLKGASELMTRRRHELDEATLCRPQLRHRPAGGPGGLAGAAPRGGRRRRVVAGGWSPSTAPPWPARRPWSTTLRSTVAAGADRDGDTFPGDPERVRLALEILFEALGSPAGGLSAEMPAAGCVTVVAPALDLDEPQRRFALRSAFRVFDMEGCQLRVRSTGDETRAEVRLGPRRNK